jgi:protease secretion system outer membrane protein
MGLVALSCLASPQIASAQALSDAVAAAQGRDPALQSAGYNRDAARENIWIAGARLLPQVSYQETRQNTNQTTTQNTALGPQARDFAGQSYNKQLTLRQGIVRPRDVEGYRQGHMQAEYGDKKYVSAQADLWSRTASAWLDVLAARALVDSYSAALTSVGEWSRQETRRYELGDSTKDSRAEAAAQFAQARATLLDAEMNLKARERAYELLTGMAADSLGKRRIPNESSTFWESGKRNDLWSQILASAPELQAAQAAQDVSRSRANQSLYDNLPTLDLVATSTSAQNDTANTIGYFYTNRQVGIQLVVPLFSGGAMLASRRQAYAGYEASAADREALLMRIETQFTTDWAGQFGLLERAKAARSLVEAAIERRRAAQLGLAKGLRTWAELSNAELLLARRSSDLAGLQVALFKTQARILALLPVQSPEWESWVGNLDAASAR